MKVRYFPKRGNIWIDWRTPEGERKRQDTKVPVGRDKEAERAATGIIARTLAGLSAPSVPASETVAPKTPKRAASGWTIQSAYKHAMRTRPKWMQAKDRKGIESKQKEVEEYWGEEADLADCTREAVQDWRETMMVEDGRRKGEKMAPSTINKYLSHLSVLLEACDLPPHNVKFLSVQGSERKRRAREEELQQVIEFLLSARHHITKEPLVGASSFADLIPLAQQSAARQGEWLALLWTDVYFDRKVVRFRDPKNGESREVPLLDDGMAILEARKKLGLLGPFKDLTKHRCTALWDQARRAIGLENDREFVFHVGTRHEGLSRLADAGSSAFIIKAMAGHKSIVTSDKYVKPRVESLREMQAKAAETKRT